MLPIKLIVGLGNPGGEYEKTRHNAGFWFLDLLAKELQCQFKREGARLAECAKVSVAGETRHLAKPSTFMNRSGQAVAALIGFFKIPPQQMLIAHDDLDLPAGTVRFKYDGGHGGQNGLKDTMAVLGHGEFHRLRIGIGHPGYKDRVTPWVLGRPSAVDELAIRDAIERAVAAFPLMAAGDAQAVMQRLHAPNL